MLYGAGCVEQRGGRAERFRGNVDEHAARVRDVAEVGEQALAWVLTGGEDHALAATFPRGVALPSRWTVIGEVRQGRGVLVDGQAWVGQAGWDHFI